MSRLPFLPYFTLLLILLLCAGCGPPRAGQFNGTLLVPPVEVEDFQFETARGMINTKDFEDRYIILAFGYTFCPDACPTTMARLARVMDTLGEDAAQVQVILVSVDPERDTPDRLDTYVNNFNPNFIGAVPKDTASLFDNLGVFAERAKTDNADQYTVDHTTSIVLLDRTGYWQLVWNFEVPPEEIAQDLKTLLASS